VNDNKTEAQAGGQAQSTKADPMQRRRFLKAAGGAAAAAAGGTFAAPAFSQNRMKWRMGLAWPKNAPALATGPKVMAEFVQKASGGRLTIELFGAGELVPPLELLDATANGTIEAAHSYPTFWAGKDPAFFMVAPLPFGITSQEQQAWLEYGGGLELCERVYARHGVKFFPLGNTGVQGFGWSTKELNTVEDFRGLKMRIGGLSGRVLKELGATVVVMPLGEVLQALQSGAIDAAEFVGPYNDLTFGLYRPAKYYYWPGVVEPCGIVDAFVNMDVWNELPDDLKEIVRVGMAHGNTVQFNDWVYNNGYARKTLVEEYGVDIRTLSDEILSRMGEISRDVITAEAEKDQLAREMLESIVKYRDVMRPYTQLSEMEFMRARELPFKYVQV